MSVRQLQAFVCPSCHLSVSFRRLPEHHLPVLSRVCLSVMSCVCLSVLSRVCLSVMSHVCLFVLSHVWDVRPVTCLSVHHVICLSVRPVTCMSVRHVTCMSVRPITCLGYPSCHVSVCPSCHMSVCPSASGVSLDIIYRCLNRTILYQLSRPMTAVADQTNILDALHKLTSNRSLVFGPGNYDQEFIGCLCYCLLQLAEDPTNIRCVAVAICRELVSKLILLLILLSAFPIRGRHS